MSAKPRNGRRKRLQQQNGLCHWCDTPVQFGLKGKRGQQLPHSATEDHVFPKGDPRRIELATNTGVITKVIACFQCNNERGGMPYDEFLKRKRPEWA